jgi:hypothetical protein
VEVYRLSRVAQAFQPAFPRERQRRGLESPRHTVTIYRWQGLIDEDGEQLLIIKTTDANVIELREALMKGHPCDVPSSPCWK